VRILVTNDDGVGAPGLAALTRALVAWAADAGSDGPAAAHEIIVVAPSSNFSGASAAVGSVTDRTTITYQRAIVEGAESVEAYGLDAPPALSVIAGALGAVGPKPDLVLSGINHGVNVGRYCRIREAIVDKHVILPPNTVIGHDLDHDRRRGFHVTEQGVVIITRAEMPQ